MTPPQPRDERQSTGAGCVLGGLATFVALAGGSIMAGLVAANVMEPVDDPGQWVVLALVGLVPLGLLVAAAVYWRKTPGFLLGIGLTVGIGLALFTGCVAILSSM